jgi:hypothetical protein
LKAKPSIKYAGKTLDIMYMKEPHFRFFATCQFSNLIKENENQSTRQQEEHTAYLEKFHVPALHLKLKVTRKTKLEKWHVHDLWHFASFTAAGEVYSDTECCHASFTS